MNQKLKSVLLVDDDQDMLNLLNKILSAAGYKVITAIDPVIGRKLIEEEAPHIIISDLHMEPEDGFQFIQSIRQQNKYNPIPILVLSALNDFPSVKKAIALGVNDYVIKPLQPAMLIRKIKKALLNKDFIQWQPKAGAEPEMEISISASVPALGEAGYHLRGPFKITAGKEIKTDFPEFISMKLTELHQTASNFQKTYQSGGEFINDMTFLGMNEASSLRIRQFILKRTSDEK